MKDYKKNIFVYMIFLILSILVMFPVVVDMSGVMYGLPGDAYFKIWENWHFKYAFLHTKPLYFSDFIGAPFGVDLSRIPYYIFWDKLTFITTLLSNEIVAYNFFIFLGFFLSGITMYYLMLYLIKDRSIGLFSGILYMLCPYHLAHSLGHLTLTSIQWLPLFILLTLKFCEKANIRNCVFLGFSLGLVFISDYYYGIFSYMIFFVFLLLIVVINNIKITRKFAFYLLISLLGSAIIISLFILPVYRNSAAQYAGSAQSEFVITHARPAREIFTGSARPLSYLLPCYMHPVFGGFTKLFIGSPFYGETEAEHSLYLGILPLLLAWVAIKKRTKMSKIFLYLFIASVLFSLPPYIKIFSLFVPLPSFLLFKLVPRIRVYARFGVFAMLCVSVLAGFGLKEYIGRINVNSRKICIYFLSIVIVIMEFLVNPLQYKVDLRRPPEVYTWLSQQEGDFIICEYPLNESPVIRTDWLIWQRIHKKRQVDGALPDSLGEKVREHILRLQDKDTPRILSWLGVKYVIIHLKDMEKSETVDIIGELPDFNKQAGLSLVKEFEDTQVYQITAKPLNPGIR